MTTNIAHFEEKLKEELATLEKELATVGRKNEDKGAEWEAVEPTLDIDKAEDGEIAEGIEGYNTNSAIVDQLEARLIEVENALEKTKQGTFGTCDVCGAQIEEDRLEANPAAPTCTEHMN